MSRDARTRCKPLGLEPLEGRPLLSAVGAKPLHKASAPIVARLDTPKLSFNVPPVQAFSNAYFAGAGREFVAFAEKEFRTPPSVVAGFGAGTITHYKLPGIAVKVPNFQSGYTGPRHDTLALNVGGVVALKNHKFELGAIVLGPFTTAPFTSTIVFGINRGDGQRLGPYYPSRPGITPDVLVIVTVGPYGQSSSATITDLTTGTTQSISSSAISAAGPTVRILLDASQLTSRGFTLKQYTFAVWTATEPNAPIQDVGSFIPEDSMGRIGIETNVRPTI